MDNRLGRIADTQFLTDAFVDQHVRVDRHADGQRDGRHAGQCQCRLQHRQQRHQQDHVDGQRDDGGHAEHRVINDHEHGDHRKTDPGGMEAALDVFRTQARTDGTFLDDLDGCGERAGTQQQCQIARFRVVQAGDLETIAQLIVDARDVDDFLDLLLCLTDSPSTSRVSTLFSMNTTAISLPISSLVALDMLWPPLRPG